MSILTFLVALGFVMLLDVLLDSGPPLKSDLLRALYNISGVMPWWSGPPRGRVLHAPTPEPGSERPAPVNHAPGLRLRCHQSELRKCLPDGTAYAADMGVA